MAAVTAVRLDSLIREETDLHVKNSVFFTDSAIVLHYLRNEEKRFCVFIVNRVSTICDGSTVNQWHHVPSALNPADNVPWTHCQRHHTEQEVATWTSISLVTT